MKRSRMMTALFALSMSGCGDRYVDDAAWTFRWRTHEGRVSVDRWTDQNATCRKSAANEWNLRALQHKSKLEACRGRCREARGDDQLACRLRCDAAAELVEKTCEDKQRKLPPGFWIKAG